jgi:hypothetical protein
MQLYLTTLEIVCFDLFLSNVKLKYCGIILQGVDHKVVVQQSPSIVNHEYKACI